MRSGVYNDREILLSSYMINKEYCLCLIERI